MASYVIGDVQGCFLTFKRLLQAISFDERRDSIILLGDIVNRGPRSLEMLRFVYEHQQCINMVLGNHDIFLIALVLKAIKTNKTHTLHEVLEAEDRFLLTDYLRSRPLMIRSEQDLFVHAGIFPSFTLAEAEKKAQDLSEILAGPKAIKFLARYLLKTPNEDLPNKSYKRALRLALASFTLIRMCEPPLRMHPYNGELKLAPSHLKAWFFLRDDKNINIYFGHWAALGFYQYKNYICLDSGCVWGHQLTALRLADGQVFKVDFMD